MRAVCYRRYGPPEVLEVREVPAPQAGDDEVVIRVRAAEVTKADCELRAFRYSVKWFWLPLRLAMGVIRPRRQILGAYFAGEIAAIGRKVSEFSVGDAVYGSAGMRFGAYGEYLSLPATASLARKPSSMSFEQAAAVPLGGLNALHFLRLAEVQPGQQVLVNGAGGSIGAHAVQIAKAMGAEVTAVDGSNKQGLLERLGVDHFIDYTTRTFTSEPGKYDVIFDMVPASNYAACLGVLKPGGRYVAGNPTLSVMFRAALTNRFGDKRAIFAFARETKEELSALCELIEGGQLRSIVDRVFPMEQAREAHRLVETEGRRGAIVLDLGRASGQDKSSS